MAAPAYTEDLTDIALMESGQGGVVALNISGGGGGAPAFGADFSIQGAGCWDKTASNSERAIGCNQSPGAGTVAAGVHIFQWGLVGTPGVTDTLALRGVYVLAGTSTNNFVQFHVEGNDTFGAQGRVGKCYAYNYVTTANTGSSPYRTTNGSPGATPTIFGYGISTISTVKGSNFGMDAVRYGTGAYLTAGELISAGDASDDPCTFFAYSVQNDLLANRWGILTGIGGTNYELQGRFVIGQNNSKVATLARFRDSNINISIVDTVHSETDFSQIIIDHASTRAELTNLNLTALGTNNPGQFNVTTNDPTVIISGGAWTGIGVVELQGNTTSTGLTLRNTGVITTNGATMSGGSVANNTSATGAIVINSPTEFAALSGINFTDNNRAIEITTAGTYSCDAHQFSGNTIEINFTGTGTCTVGPVNGSNVVQANCEATGGGTITVTAVTTQVTITGVPVGLEGRVRRGVVSLYHVQNITTGSFVYSYTGSAGKPFDLIIGGVSDAGDAYERNPLVLSEDGVAITIPFTATINPSYV